MDQYSMEMLAKKRPDWWIGYCAFGNLGRINIRLDDPFIPDFIAIEESSINTQLLEDARNNILPVYVWTVDDLNKMNKYLEMGINGIISDKPYLTKEALAPYTQGHDSDSYYFE